jgi:hypothetical protein
MPKISAFLRSLQALQASREMAMVLPGLVAAWNYWMDISEPQDLMDHSRVHGYTTVLLPRWLSPRMMCVPSGGEPDPMSR